MFNPKGVINNLDEKFEVITKTVIAMKKLYPSFNLKVSFWKTYALSKILFLAPYIVSTKKQIEKIDELCNWFLFDKKTFIPQKTIRDIAKLQNTVNNGGKNLFSFLHYEQGCKTKILARCNLPEFQNKSYIILLRALLDIRFQKQNDNQLHHPLLKYHQVGKEKYKWMKQAMLWYNEIPKSSTYTTSKPKETVWYKEVRTILNTNTQTETNFLPCLLNKKKHPIKSELSLWNNVTISITDLPKNPNTRYFITLNIKQIPFTSSQLLFIQEGYNLKKFFHNIATIEKVNNFRTNCALNKWGRNYHYPQLKRCSHCNELNNSMHIVYCNHLNNLEFMLNNDNNAVIKRIKASKNHKSPDHAHSWIINKARWDTNNQIIFNPNVDNTPMNLKHQANFLEMKIKRHEHNHLQYIVHLKRFISFEQLKTFRYYTIISGKVVEK